MANIKVSDEVHSKLMARAAAENKTASDLIDSMLEGNDLVEKLDKGEYIDPLLVDLESFELPECCQKIYDDEKPLMKNCCQHWVKAYQNWYGRQIITYKNTLTGMYYSDYVQEYLGQ